MNKPEILAPAGDLEKLKYAVLYGADAVYLGLSNFTMRATQKMAAKDLKDAVSFAHEASVRVYLTCNILPRNQDLDSLPSFLLTAVEAGVDALIIADLGIMELAKNLAPELEIHISTQAGITNYKTAAELFKLGAKRVILARELSLDEIKRIRRETPQELELEVFVHGAMCMAFSGRCLLSSFLTGRDANRGECAQPCRWKYSLVEEKRPNEYYELFEDDFGSYILNSKDLCMLEYIQELSDAGINSFKIEGRAKSFYYVAVVTNAYKQAVKGYFNDPKGFVLPKYLKHEVQKVSHRRYCTGFFFGNPEDAQFYENGGYIRNYDVVATVDYCRDEVAYCTLRNKLASGTKVEAISPGEIPEELEIQSLWNEDGEEIGVANHAMMKLSFKTSKVFKPGTILRRPIIG